MCGSEFVDTANGQGIRRPHSNDFSGRVRRRPLGRAFNAARRVPLFSRCYFPPPRRALVVAFSARGVTLTPRVAGEIHDAELVPRNGFVPIANDLNLDPSSSRPLTRPPFCAQSIFREGITGGCSLRFNTEGTGAMGSHKQ